MRVGRNVNKKVDLLHLIWPKEKKANSQDVHCGRLPENNDPNTRSGGFWLVGKGGEFFAFSSKKYRKMKFLNFSHTTYSLTRVLCQIRALQMAWCVGHVRLTGRTATGACSSLVCQGLF